MFAEEDKPEDVCISSSAVADGIISDVLDSVFPAEAEASQVLATILDKVDRAIVPPPPPAGTQRTAGLPVCS